MHLFLKNDINKILTILCTWTSLAIFSGFSERKLMGLGALKARWKCASNGLKIIQIDLPLFVGDQFQKYYLEAWEAHDSEILYIHVQ